MPGDINQISGGVLGNAWEPTRSVVVPTPKKQWVRPGKRRRQVKSARPRHYFAIFLDL
jgi:hypothetical protein